MKRELDNYAFIDGQNLYMGTSKKEKDAWSVDLKKFRIYLKENYGVSTAYYHLGFVKKDLDAKDLYDNIQKSGFILNFRQHNEAMMGKKKGNVDSDIIFSIMKKLYKKEILNKIILVSGDGDYKDLVDFLIKENKFLKLLMPDIKRGSSLYKSLGSEYYDGLDNIRNIIGYKQKDS